MGGYGSGPTGGSRYRTVGSCDRLDLTQLLRSGHLRSGQRNVTGWGWWDDQGAVRDSVLLTFDLGPAPRYRISYGTRPAGSEPKVVELSGKLLRTFPHYGGVRWWWACPSCGRRARVLHRPRSVERFACRRCHQLRYFIQRLTTVERLKTRSERFYAKAGRSLVDDSSFIRKRKGMHWRTFARLMNEGNAAEERAFELHTRCFVRRLAAREVFGPTGKTSGRS